MNDGILTQTQTPPAMPYGLLGRPSPVPMPASPASFDPRSLPGLVAYWPFDEDASISNAIALDASGNGFHLTSSGALATPGRSGGGRLLSAGGGQWNPSPARLSRGSWNATPQWDATATGWSVAFWLFTDLNNNTQGTGSTAAGIGFSTIASAGAESVRLGSGTPANGFSTISSRCYFTDNSFLAYQTGINLPGGMTSITPQGQWTHLAFVADPTTRTYTMYVNGAPRTPLLYASDKVLSSFSSGLPCNMQWPGAIDEAVVYNRALTASEVQRLAGVPLAPASVSTLHPECRSWISRVLSNGGTVSTTTASAVNDFCNAIDAAGIRDRFYRLNLFCGSNLAACLVPLYRGTSLGGTQFGNATDTNVNFAAGNYVETGSTGGLTGNAASTYLNTGLNASTLPISTSGIHVGAHLLSTTVTSGSVRSPIGVVSNKVYIVAFDFRNSPATIAATDFGVYANSVNPAFPNLHLASLLGTNVQGTFRIGGNSFTSADTRTSDDITGSENIYVMARNSSGGFPGQYWGGRVGGYSIGTNMTAAQSASLRSAMDAFQTALGRNV